MRNFSILALMIAILVSASSETQAVLVELIGGSDPGLRNGDLQDLSGAMQITPADVSTPALSQGDGTRAATSSYNVGQRVTIPFWTARRSFQNQNGNAFFGFDDGTGTTVTGGGDIGMLWNTGEEEGTVDLIHDPFNAGVTLLAGSVFTLTFEMGTDADNDDVQSVPLLSVGGTALSPDSITLSNVIIPNIALGAASEDDSEILMQGPDTSADVTVVYTLAADAASDLIEFTLDNALQNDDGGGNRTAFDQFGLTVDTAAVPEASSFLAVGMIACVGGLRRRRS